jgi:ABC-type transport system substrate-binding protein
LLVEPSSFQIFFELNTAKPPFNDPRVRLAVNYAVDRQGIIDKILQGYGKIPDGIFPEGVQGRVAQTPYPYDPDKAKALLDEAFPGGYQGKIVMWTPAGRYPKDKTVAEVVQSYLNQIGLNTEFKVWEWAAYQKTLYNSQPGEGTGKGSNAANMWLLGTGITEADYRVRRKFYTGDPSNLTGYSNPDIDKLLNDASVEMNYEKRMEDYGKLQDIAWNKAPNALTLFNGVQLVGTAKNISGLEIFSNELIRLDQVTKQ